MLISHPVFCWYDNWKSKQHQSLDKELSWTNSIMIWRLANVFLIRYVNSLVENSWEITRALYSCCNSILSALPHALFCPLWPFFCQFALLQRCCCEKKRQTQRSALSYHFNWYSRMKPRMKCLMTLPFFQHQLQSSSFASLWKLHYYKRML